MTFPFTFSGNAITVFVNGVPHPIDSTHKNWDRIKSIVTGETPDVSADDLMSLINIKAEVEANLKEAGADGVVQVGNDGVTYNGKVVSSYLTERMLEMLKDGIDITPWKRFMEKLYRNPSKQVIDELYLWMEKAGMPLVENGNFLAYKKVNDDYTSFHRNPDGSLCHNDIGTVVEMPLKRGG